MKVPEIEITIKFKGEPVSRCIEIRRSKDIADVCRTLFDSNTIEWTEEFILLCLNQANKIIGFYRVSRGGFTSTVVDIKVIATVALQCCANRIIVCHNHPSGRLQASQADIDMSVKLKQAMSLLEIKLLDSLIITKESYISLYDDGML